MTPIRNYIEAAKINLGLSSNRALDRVLGNKSVSTCKWSRGYQLPSAEKMVILADAAGADPAEALLELHIHEASKRQDERAIIIYEKILAQIKQAARIAALLVFMTPVTSANVRGTLHSDSSQYIHYATTGRRRKTLKAA